MEGTQEPGSLAEATKPAPEPNSDPIALRAQADVSRLFDLVIAPALLALETPDYVIAEEPSELAPSQDASFGLGVLGGLDRVPPFAPGVMLEEVRQALVEETRRGFALILGAMFERQIRTWLAQKDPTQKTVIANENWRAITYRIKRVVRVNLREVPKLTDVLYELWELVSATRHGDGKAAENLVKIAPYLWPTDEARAKARSADIVVSEADLLRYHTAALVCWGQLGASPYPVRLLEPKSSPRKRSP